MSGTAMTQDVASSATYDIVRYQPAQRPGVVALLRHIAAADAGANDAYFRWKHEENPFVAAPVAYVVLHSGQVVGMRAFHGARWRDGDRTHAWPCACDLVVDPAHRGQGLLQRIMEVALADLAQQGHRTVLSLSANPITYHASLRSGWRLLVPYVTWAYATRRARVARRWSERVQRWPWLWRFADAPAAIALQRDFTVLDARWVRRHGGSPCVLDRAPRPDAMAALVEATRAPALTQVRNATYYRWRFRNPQREYRFVYWGQRALAGFLVLQRPRYRDDGDFFIVDHAAEDPDILATMIEHVVATAGFDRLSMWTSSLPEAFTPRLAGMGFAPADTTRGDPAYRPGVLAIDIGEPSSGTPRNPVALAAARWDLRMLDSDFY